MAQAADRIGTMIDGNWANTSNWSGGVVPASTDDIRIDSGVSLTTNLTPALTGANALDSLRVANSYKGNTGASGNPLTLDVNNALDFDGGGAEAWFKVDATSADSAVINCNSAQIGLNACVIDSRSAAIDLINVNRGRVTLSGSGTFTTVNVGTIGNSDAILVISAGATLTTVNATGGIITDSTTVTITAVTNSGATYTQGGGTLTTVNLHSGKHVFNDGTITTLNAFGGTLDASEDATDRTITTLHAYTGAVIDLQAGAGTITITNLYIHGHPTIFWPDGAILSL